MGKGCQSLFAMAFVVANSLIATAAPESKPLGEPADVTYMEGVLVGVGGTYTFDRDVNGEPMARGILILKSKDKDEYKAHETALKFEYGVSLRLEGWKGTYKGMVLKTEFTDPKLPTYVFVATEGSTMANRRHYHATALWDQNLGEWVFNESALRATRK